MELKDKVVVITGGASGIGAALARRFAQEGPKALAILDRNDAGAQAVAAEVGGLAYGADLRDEHAVEALIDQIESAQGPIDLFCFERGYRPRSGHRHRHGRLAHHHRHQPHGPRLCRPQPVPAWSPGAAATC